MNPQDCVISFSNWIALCSLLVLLAYTAVTYRLFRQQKDQFQQSNRPWVYATGVTYNERIVFPELGIILLNTGKLPAQCNVVVQKISITNPFGTEIDLLTKEERRDLSVFPHSEGADLVHMFLYDVSDEHARLFTNNSRIECRLTIDYKVVGSNKVKTEYGYGAELTVEHLNDKAGKQTTLIKVISAT
jgi:hypothetical protein